jgi:hypothetical protein
MINAETNSNPGQVTHRYQELQREKELCLMEERIVYQLVDYIQRINNNENHLSNRKFDV